MATPALVALHQVFPKASTTILVRENLAELFLSCPFAEEVIALPKVSGAAKVTQILRSAGNLRRRKYDMALCFPHSFSSAFMFQLAGIRHRVGYSAEGRSVFLTQSLPYPPDGERSHRVRFYCQLVELVAGQELSITPLQVWPRSPGAEEMTALERKIGGYQNLIIVAPGSVGPAKQWPPARYAKTVERLVSEKCVRVALVGAAHDKPACDEVARLAAVPTFNLAGETTLTELYALFQKCRLFLGNDSGAGHLAAAAGPPVVILAGAGDPDEIAPWTEKRTVLFKKIFCSPCYRNVCRRKDHPVECLDMLGEEEVWRGVEFWLEKTGRKIAAV